MKNRKRLLIISGAINFGAPGKIVEQIGLLAEKDGYEVLVAHSTRNENPSQLSHIHITTFWQEIRHALGARLFDLHGLLSTRQTEILIDKIKAFDPDVIHLHNIHGYFLNFRVLFEYLKTIDIPIIWTLHDCWAFTGRCFHFEGIGCEKWKTECYDCKAEKGYTVSPFYDRSQQLYNLKKSLIPSVRNLTLVPVSEWLSKFLKDSFLKDCNVTVIQNGVDLNVFRPLNGDRLRVKHGLHSKFVILGVAAPWNKRKGLDDFFKLRELLSDDYAILLVGLSQKQVNHLPKGIIGITRTESQSELAEYYSMSDVFCNLTYLDTFPTVNLEALACGTPIVTYRTGGSPEAVNESTGIIVPQGDISAIANTLNEIKSQARFKAADCRRHAEMHFNKDTQFHKYIELYNRLLSSNN